MRKPVFIKVDQLRPGTNGHNLVAKVVSSKMVLQKGRPDGPQVRQMRIAECLIGDETGTIVFTARNEQGIIVGISNLVFVKYYRFTCCFLGYCWRKEHCRHIFLCSIDYFVTTVDIIYVHVNFCDCVI